MKFSVITKVAKPNKPFHLPTSYRPISLLPVLAKNFKRLLVTDIQPTLDSIIPNINLVLGYHTPHLNNVTERLAKYPLLWKEVFILQVHFSM